MSNFYSLSDVCHAVKISKSTYYRWKLEGRLPFKPVYAGRKPLFPIGSVDNWLASLAQAASAQGGGHE